MVVMAEPADSAAVGYGRYAALKKRVIRVQLERFERRAATAIAWVSNIPSLK